MGDIYSHGGNKCLARNTENRAQNYCFNYSGESIINLFDENNVTLAYNDNFNGQALNTDIWKYRDSGYYGKSSTNENYEYIPEDQSSNVFVSEGNLTLKNLKNYPASDAEWSGPFIDSQNKFKFRYGKIECKIKFSSDSYYHASLWMRSNDYLLTHWGEIDISQSDGGKVDAGVIWGNYPDLQSQQIGYYTKDNAVASEYHTYTMVWDENEIWFLCDDIPMGKFDITEDQTIDGVNPFREYEYLILNCLPCTASPFQFSENAEISHNIDYIKVYSNDAVIG